VSSNGEGLKPALNVFGAAQSWEAPIDPALPNGLSTNRLFVTGISWGSPRTVILFVLAFISPQFSHILYMTPPTTARAAALVPGTIWGATNPVAVLFISTVGMDYCLTFQLVPKPLMFQELEGETYKPADFTAFVPCCYWLYLGLM